jgi:hypothetical protein
VASFATFLVVLRLYPGDNPLSVDFPAPQALTCGVFFILDGVFS